VNAVTSGGKYSLYKEKNQEGDVNLNFDFSGLKGGGEDIIMALVSVEKVFRFYRSSNNLAIPKIPADKKIDAFLRAHFQQYVAYCSEKEETPDTPLYVYYKGLEEDPQYDDLTLLALQKL
jgi:hypothetical protein